MLRANKCHTALTLSHLPCPVMSVPLVIERGVLTSSGVNRILCHATSISHFFYLWRKPLFQVYMQPAGTMPISLVNNAHNVNNLSCDTFFHVKRSSPIPQSCLQALHCFWPKPAPAPPLPPRTRTAANTNHFHMPHPFPTPFHHSWPFGQQLKTCFLKLGLFVGRPN